MNLERYDRVYFLGVGGIGMSALARYFNQKGLDVAGYDKTPSPLTDALKAEGIKIHFDDHIKDIPSHFKDIERTLVVYTPAIPANHIELNYFKENQFDVHKRAVVVAAIANQGKCIAVAGTHGKTTTSSLVAHILKVAKKSVSAFLGGISTNYNSNFIVGKAKEVVIEADEYDRSFLNLRPYLAILTSMDADHLDIYHEGKELKKTFKAFMALVKPEGIKIVNAKLELDGISYSLDTPADYKGHNLHIENGTYIFDVKYKEDIFKNIICGLPGRHNAENALAAFAACHQLGLKPEVIKVGIESFSGVKRRFEYHIKTDNRIYIDDYAHHPQELKSLIVSARELYPSKKLTLAFQPHLFSRTKDFADEFAEVLSKVDNLLMLDIYPAREEPLPGITSQWLLSKVDGPKKQLIGKNELTETLINLNPELIITAGAGDIDHCVKPIKKALKS